MNHLLIFNFFKKYSESSYHTDFQELKLRQFLNTPVRPGIIRSETKLTLLTEIRTNMVLS